MTIPQPSKDRLIEALKAEGAWADKRLWAMDAKDGPSYEIHTYQIQPGAALLGGSYNYIHHSILASGMVQVMAENGEVTTLVAPYTHEVPKHTRHLIKALTYAVIMCIHPKE